MKCCNCKREMGLVSTIRRNVPTGTLDKEGKPITYEQFIKRLKCDHCGWGTTYFSPKPPQVRKKRNHTVAGK